MPGNYYCAQRLLIVIENTRFDYALSMSIASAFAPHTATMPAHMMPSNTFCT
jgi:hypothetical protein